jgi:hypothetical protein
VEHVVERLVKEGLLDADGAALVRDAIAAGKPLDDALRAAKGASEEKVLRFLATDFDIPFVDLEKDAAKYVPSKELLAKFPARILIDHRLMPIAENADGITVVTSKVFDHSGLDELRLATGFEFHPVLSTSSEVDRFT